MFWGLFLFFLLKITYFLDLSAKSLKCWMVFHYKNTNIRITILLLLGMLMTSDFCYTSKANNAAVRFLVVSTCAVCKDFSELFLEGKLLPYTVYNHSLWELEDSWKQLCKSPQPPKLFNFYISSMTFMTVRFLKFYVSNQIIHCLCNYHFYDC